MSAVSDVIAVLGGSGGLTAATFCGLWLTGQIHTRAEIDARDAELERVRGEKDAEIRELKHALGLERQRSDAGVLTGQLVRDVLGGLRREIEHP